VDPVLRRLTRADDVVKIDPRNLRVLQLLASRPGQVVSQAEIERIAWSGVVVTPASVYQSIAQLRRALGGEKDGHRYIETVPRHGYRLIVPAGPEPTATAAGTEAENANAMAPPRWRSRGPLIALVAIFALLIVTTAIFRTRSEEVPVPIAPGEGALPAQTNAALGTRAELPRNYRSDATFRQAITFLEGQLRTQSDTAGENDPGLVAILSRLANLYPLVSDPVKSEQAARRGLTILTRVSGESNAEGVELHATLAEALADTERYEEAEEHLQRAIELSRAVHGERSEALAMALNQMALLRIAQRRFAAAVTEARRAIDIYRALPDAIAPRTAFLHSTLAWALAEQGQPLLAITVMRDVLKPVKPEETPAPYLVALSYHFFGEALVKAGRYAEAEAALRTERVLFAKIPHARMDGARADSALGEALLMQGNVQEATSMLMSAREALRDGDGWRERKARQETEDRIQRLPRS
jgi:DNA-binding winged helix-turn-helix (wHTH) protein/tetratricopeptide (TPR) repeat protein